MLLTVSADLRASVSVRLVGVDVSMLDAKAPKGNALAVHIAYTRVTQPNTCNYEHCMRPTTHKTEGCLFAKLAAKIGPDP